MIDWMPGISADCPHWPACRGEYQLHNWPRTAPFNGWTEGIWDHHPVACHLPEAMRIVEHEWDEMLLASLAGIGTPP